VTHDDADLLIEGEPDKMNYSIIYNRLNHRSGPGGGEGSYLRFASPAQFVSVRDGNLLGLTVSGP